MNKMLKRSLSVLVALAMLLSSFGFTSSGKARYERGGQVESAEENAPRIERAQDDIVNIIVKLEDAPALAVSGENGLRASARDALKSKQTDLINEISERFMLGELKTLYRYTDTFNGFAFSGEYHLIEKIKKLPGVANCYESWSYALPEMPKGEDEQERLGTSVGFINADDMWALGYTGRGKTVAVIDTGITGDHPAFTTPPESPHFTVSSLQSVLDAEELLAEQKFSGTLTAQELYYSAKIPFAFNYYLGNADASHNTAYNDHGTHVSSIAAGNSALCRGVAYDAQIIAMQVFRGIDADWVDILAALEDCAHLRVDALNMSLGADCGFSHDDDMQEVIDLLSASGVNCAVASGNSGTTGAGNVFNGTTPVFNVDNGTTNTPGTLSASLSVAASYNEAGGSPTTYSSWGPTPDLRIKPEIMAPGDSIYAATDPEIGGSEYGIKSGTSMATPHIAGGMLLLKQYVDANFPNLDAFGKMQMIDSLLMSTAVPAVNGGKPYSPRQQGAGQADLTAAISTKVYIDVPSCVRPKIELGDDDAKSGVFSFDFELVNFGSSAKTYTVRPSVLTEETSFWLINNRLQTIMNHASEDITSFVNVTAPSSVTVPANGRTSVSVTIDLAGYKQQLDSTFPVGIYIDGFIMLDGEVDLSVPFLGFYGDWEYASVFDRTCYYDRYLGMPEWTAQWGSNRAGSYIGYESVNFGVNPFGATTNFLLDRSSISPNGDDRMDAISLVHVYMLRNAEIFRYEVENAATGENYYTKEIPYVAKAVKNTFVSFYQPVGAEEYTQMDPFYGDGLADGTTVTLRMTGIMQSYDEFDPAANENAIWEIPVTIDRTAPHIVSSSLENGALSLRVTDEHYAAYVGIYSDAGCTQLIAERVIEEDSRGAVTELGFDVGSRETVYVKLGDYAANTAVIRIDEGSALVPGDADLNGSVSVADAILALRHAMGLSALSGQGFANADMDSSGTVTTADAIVILRMAMGLMP